MANLRVSKITIKNVLGVEDVEFSPGRLTVIKGKNGTGKTSVLEAIRSALRGGHDATLVRHGAIEGEVILVLDDGVEIDKRINDKSASVSVKSPEYGKVSKPQTVIDGLVNQLGVNPVDLLTAPPAKQKEIFLKAMPMKVTRDQVLDATGLVDNNGDFNQHGLDVLDSFRKELYDHRTGVNRALKEKQATAKQLESSLPERPAEGDWKFSLLATEDMLENFDRESAHARQQIQAEWGEKMRDVSLETMRQVQELHDQAHAKIEVIKDDLHEKTKQLQDDLRLVTSTYQEKVNEILHAHDAEVVEKRTQHVENKQHAATMVEMEAKAESARQLLDKMRHEYVSLNDEAKKLTQAISGLDRLKDQLAKSLPIAGLEVRDGELYLFNTPLSRWNESVRVQLAIDIAKLSAGKLGLILVDGLERLDKETFEAFVRHAEADDSCQYVVSRVTEDPQLSIETF